MTSIDSAGRTQAAAAYTRTSDPTFDPAAVLLALSAQQMTIMQITLAASVTGARSEVSKIAAMGSTSAEVNQLRDQVIAGEASAVEQALATARSLSSKYAGGDASPTVSAADLDRIKVLENFAAERGFALQDTTRLEPPGDEAIGAAKAANTDFPPPTLVIDEAAARTNALSLAAYLADVKSGAADNPAIRQTMTSAPGAADLLNKVRSFGYQGDVDSLADLQAAAQFLDQAAVAELTKLAASTNQVKQLAEQISGKGADFKDLLKDRKIQPHPQDEADRLKAELKLAALRQSLKEVLEEHAAAIAGAEALAGAGELPPDILTMLVGRLTPDDRVKMEQDLAKWQADFAAKTAVESTGPSHNSLAAMRRNYL
jgi:hypothetical protein